MNSRRAIIHSGKALRGWAQNASLVISLRRGSVTSMRNTRDRLALQAYDERTRLRIGCARVDPHGLVHEEQKRAYLLVLRDRYRKSQAFQPPIQINLRGGPFA